MKLISTISPISKSGRVCGDLHLFFSSLNHKDIKKSHDTPPELFWNVAGNGCTDAYVLASHDKVELALNLLGDQIPGQLYIMGAIIITPAGGTAIGPNQLGGIKAPPPFVAGAPHIELLQGSGIINNGGINAEIGFYLSVPWDGTNADCKGKWWAAW
jgi:hypothetical protein